MPFEERMECNLFGSSICAYLDHIVDREGRLRERDRPDLKRQAKS